MSKLKIFIHFSIITLLYSSIGNATIYDHAFIENFAKTFVEKNIPVPVKGKMKVTPAKIDPRVNIRQCPVPLSANIPENYSSRNVNIKIFCESSTPWHIFIPVKIQTTLPVVVAQNKISKGSILNKENLTIEWRDQYKLRGEVIDNLEPLIGAKSKRTLSKGAVISKKSICVVCKGDNVTILAKSNGFVIKTEGTALKNATLGEQVRVKNNRSGRTIVAQVKAINQVIINL